MLLTSCKWGSDWKLTIKCNLYKKNHFYTTIILFLFTLVYIGLAGICNSFLRPVYYTSSSSCGKHFKWHLAKQAHLHLSSTTHITLITLKTTFLTFWNAKKKLCSINTLLLSGAVANLVWLKLKLYIIAVSITLGHPGREQIWQLSTCQSELNSLVLSQSLCQCPSPQWNYSWKHQPENGFKISCKYFVCSPRIFQIISYCNWQMDKN